ncbi:ROK family transcriptional regulator [Allostreptomyces psammosilenae]|uniref:Putative NBD/HSP70 family sugar kinase n=1 Tax=Allostreptomyces psammosilenae TaxID=1892865 RepID=A0A852ZQM7_9ACTN|nr:ROK family transcriptional regulator [Allostreptomyces psammosilenae]NYI03580.1 putative NBD/HSP70 family sugar kinase [Allostreptomyces psammosilenae]
MAKRDRLTVRDLRRGNRSKVLRRVYFEGPLSRQELTLVTGLSSGSISNVVAELAAEGLLEEAGAVDSDGGRPRTLLRVAPASGYLVGVDVGETRVRAELFDLSLTEIARAERPLSDRGYDVDHVVDHVGAVLAELLDADAATRERLYGVGIGVPGIIEHDPRQGVVVHGQTVGWDAVPLEALVRERTDLPPDVPLFVDNGAKTLGQAEMWFGGGRGAREAVVALFGSGVGACVVTPDGPYGGLRGQAAEWGHTIARVGGRPCRCGGRGHLEAYVGAEALIERWREAGGQPPEADQETALAALLAAARPTDAATPADPTAAALLEETAEYLGAAVATMLNLFQPERFILGGWAGLLLGPHLLPAVRRHADAYTLRRPAQRATIELGRLGPDAVTVGAATLPLAEFFEHGGSRPTPVALPR